MTKEEESALVLAAQAGDRAAVNKLLLAFRPLVISLARKSAEGTDLDDAIQEGTIGLLHAIQSCDLAKGALHTHARIRIREAIQRWRRQYGRMFETLPDEPAHSHAPRDQNDDAGEYVPPELRSEPTQEVACAASRLTARERAAIAWDDMPERTAERIRASVRGKL